MSDENKTYNVVIKVPAVVPIKARSLEEAVQGFYENQWHKHKSVWAPGTQQGRIAAEAVVAYDPDPPADPVEAPLEFTPLVPAEWTRSKDAWPPQLPAALLLLISDGPDSQSLEQAGDLEWDAGLDYIGVFDEAGVPYCSGEGLEPWAEYVTTDQDGKVYQHPCLPFVEGLNGAGAFKQWKNEAGSRQKPKKSWAYRAPGHAWDQSLMRVWRPIE